MIKFQFTARCGEESIPLEVSLPYKPGRQSQKARRLAVGELLAALACEHAVVRADGEERVLVEADEATWVIAEGGSVKPVRRGI